MKLVLRRLNVWLVPPLAVAGLQALIYSWDFAGQLPNPMAIHWGITMQPDGFVSVSDFALTVLILQLAIWLPSIAADIWPKSKIRIRNLLILVFGIVFWLLTAILCVSLFIQVGATDAAAVDFPWPVFAVLLLSILFLLGFLLSMPEVLEFNDDPNDWLTLWPKSHIPWEGSEGEEPDEDGLYRKWDGSALFRRRSEVSAAAWALVYQQQDIQEDSIFRPALVQGSIDGRRRVGNLNFGSI